jgi:adenylate cyclase
MAETPMLTYEQLQKLLSARRTIDALLESGLLYRQSVAQTAQEVLDSVIKLCGAQAAFLQTYNEDLSLTLYTQPNPLSIDIAPVIEGPAAKERERISVKSGDVLMTSVPLDVSGNWFGRFGVVVSAESDTHFLYPLLDEISEEIDDYIAPIYEAREKHQLIMRLSDALWNPVLELGLKSAGEVLCAALGLHKLLVVYRPDKEDAPAQLYFLDRRNPSFATKHLLGAAQTYLNHQDKSLLSLLSLEGAKEEVLLAGGSHQIVIGRLVAESEKGFCTFDRDMIASFSELLRQRLVDYGKEWRKLTESFCSRDAARLLSHPEYKQKFLFPQEQEIAIVYTDISGFTQVSEQVLQSPHAVSDLIEAWSKEAVRLVWAEGGVFDKMVGDCVIALFGPPFYEGAASEYLTAVIRCATQIREMTRVFHQRESLNHVKLPELGVATGINVARCMTGYFGPNSNFTCFSSGMNNTARLQGIAAKHEILVMSAATRSVTGFSFGEERSAMVKNVAEPLRFRPLLGGV